MGELQWTSQESNSKHENSCDDFDVVGTCSYGSYSIGCIAILSRSF